MCANRKFALMVLALLISAVFFLIPLQEATASLSRTPAVKVPAGTPKRKIVYLTFDDGPSKNTRNVLSVLRKHKVQATFFVTGQNPSNFPVMREAYRQGNTVALHSWTHNYGSVYRSKTAFWSELFKIQREVKKQTGVTSKYFRFPGGSSNTVSRKYSRGIVTRMAADLTAKGYRYYDWNVSSNDSGSLILSGTRISANVISGIKAVSRSGRSSVVLMHDSSRNRNIHYGVDKIIKWGKANGYYFVRLDSATPQVHHRIAN